MIRTRKKVPLITNIETAVRLQSQLLDCFIIIFCGKNLTFLLILRCSHVVMGNVPDLHKSPVHCNGRVFATIIYFMFQPTFFSNVYILLQVMSNVLS